MVEISNITKKYQDKFVVQVPYLKIDTGESIGIAGSNGSGKTTLLKVLVNLIAPTSGEVRLFGKSIGDEEWRKNLSCFLDDDCLINFLRPEEYFNLTAALRGIKKNELSNFYQRMGDFFAGEILKTKKYINDFSKGNRQKIGIGAALLGDTNILVLDEPMSHLDTNSKDILKNMLLDRVRKSDKVTLISDHDPSMIDAITNRLIVMEKGMIISDTKENISA